MTDAEKWEKLRMAINFHIEGYEGDRDVAIENGDIRQAQDTKLCIGIFKTVLADMGKLDAEEKNYVRP